MKIASPQKQQTPITKCRESINGLTLVELLVVVAILAIVTVVAVPAYTSSNASARITSAAEELESFIEMARSEALVRARRVTMCRSASGTACADGTEWNVGWLVWNDENENGALDTGELVRVRSAFDSRLTISGPSTGIIFTQVGALDSPSIITYTINHTGTTSKALCVNLLGKVIKC